ncbi:hypothetical protein Pcinc_041635, partial [Petrolisthes cinctipes]
PRRSGLPSGTDNTEDTFFRAAGRSLEIVLLSREDRAREMAAFKIAAWGKIICNEMTDSGHTLPLPPGDWCMQVRGGQVAGQGKPRDYDGRSVG